jgi:hypothetical protein
MQTPFTMIAGVLAFAFSSLIIAPCEAQPIELDADAAELVQVTARVDAIDKKKRLVTITGPLGHTVVVRAGPEVKNLDRVKAGDDIVVSYYEEVAVIVRKYDGPPKTDGQGFVQAEEEGMDLDPPTVEVDEAAAVAPQGAKPGAAAAETVTVTTTVEAVDYNNRVVTLKGPNGTVRKVRVGSAVQNLNEIKPGDTVTLQVTEAVAVNVQAP